MVRFYKKNKYWIFSPSNVIINNLCKHFLNLSLNKSQIYTLNFDPLLDEILVIIYMDDSHFL
jgi:hypothetical protein